MCRWHRDWGQVTGALLAAAFFGASLTPSLMPRGALEQGILAGCCAAIGLGIGTLSCKLWTFLELPVAAQPWLSRVRYMDYGVAIILCLTAIWQSTHWQNMTRSAIGLAPVDTNYQISIVVAAIMAFATIYMIAMLVRLTWIAVDRQLKKVIPRRFRVLLTFCVVGWLIWSIVDGFLIQMAFRLADQTYGAADRFIEPAIKPPTNPMRTGSSASLIKWEDLGRRGQRIYFSDANASGDRGICS